MLLERLERIWEGRERHVRHTSYGRIRKLESRGNDLENSISLIVMSVLTKTCVSCKIEKEFVCFWNNKRNKDGKENRCVDCTRTFLSTKKESLKESQRKWREKNKERLRLEHQARRAKDPERDKAIKQKYREANKDKRTNYELVKKYGITLEEYNQMSAAQNNVCDICKEPETRRHQNGTLCRLAVDHDHFTGKVRGLLCWRCNSAMGSFEERNVPILNIEEYLEKHRTESE